MFTASLARVIGGGLIIIWAIGAMIAIVVQQMDVDALPIALGSFALLLAGIAFLGGANYFDRVRISSSE